MPSARVAWFLAVATGLGLALAFPYPDFYALAWVALVPVIVASVGAGSWRRWWTGFLAGFVWRVGSLYWIAHVMINYGGMSTPVGMAVASLLAAWMALNTALILLLAPIAVRHGIVGAVVFASGWVSLEYLQAILPFGFPWSFLGYASGGSTVMMQASDLAGVWGLSFAAVFVNVVIAQRIILGRRALPSAVAAAVLVIVFTSSTFLHSSPAVVRVP